MVLSLSDDFRESCLVRERRELEDLCRTNFTSQILKECSGGVKRIKAAILKMNKKQILTKCSEKAPPIVDMAKLEHWFD